MALTWWLQMPLFRTRRTPKPTDKDARSEPPFTYWKRTGCGYYGMGKIGKWAPQIWQGLSLIFVRPDHKILFFILVFMTYDKNWAQKLQSTCPCSSPFESLVTQVSKAKVLSTLLILYLRAELCEKLHPAWLVARGDGSLVVANKEKVEKVLALQTVGPQWFIGSGTTTSAFPKPSSHKSNFAHNDAW